MTQRLTALNVMYGLRRKTFLLIILPHYNDQGPIRGTPAMTVMHRMARHGIVHINGLYSVHIRFSVCQYHHTVHLSYRQLSALLPMITSGA